jgi:hypothetical protein
MPEAARGDFESGHAAVIKGVAETIGPDAQLFKLGPSPGNNRKKMAMAAGQNRIMTGASIAQN